MIKRISKIIISTVLTISISMTSVQLPVWATEQGESSETATLTIDVSADDESEAISDDENYSGSEDDISYELKGTGDNDTIYEVLDETSDDESEEYDLDGEDIAAAGDYASGTGTESDPYRISTASQLMTAVNTTERYKYFSITKDIYINTDEEFETNTMSRIWSVNGTTRSMNHLDGNNHTVYNLYLTDASDSSTARAYSLLSNAFDDVSNLKLHNLRMEFNPETFSSYYNTPYTVAGICSSAKTIKNCSVSGDFFVNALMPGYYTPAIAGICSSSSGTDISDCYVDANIVVNLKNKNETYASGEYKDVAPQISGIIAGVGDGNTCRNCTFTGTIKGTAGYASGIAHNNNGTIINCSAGCADEISDSGEEISGEDDEIIKQMTKIELHSDERTTRECAGIVYSNKGTLSGCDNYAAISCTGSNVYDTSVSGIFCSSNGASVTKCNNYSSDLDAYIIAGIGKGVSDYSGRNVNISDCHNYGDISSDDCYKISGFFYSVSSSYGSITVSECTNEGSVIRRNCDGYTVYGLAYEASAASGCNLRFVKCGNNGIVSADAGEGNSGGFCGGLIGILGYSYTNLGTLEMVECYNSGTVISTGHSYGLVGEVRAGTLYQCYNDGSVTGKFDAAGLVGKMGTKKECSVLECYNSGPITGGEAYGIVGSIEQGTINKCFNSGKITMIGTGTMAGIVGTAYYYKTTAITVSNCFNAGIMDYGNANFEWMTSQSGGIIAKSSPGPDGTCALENCYFAGKVKPADGAKEFGAIAGLVAKPSNYVGTTQAKNLYYVFNNSAAVRDDLNVVTNASKSCTSAQMAKQDTYVGFDFPGVWFFDAENEYYKYPVLIGLGSVGLSEDPDTIGGIWRGINWKIVNGRLIITGVGQMPDCTRKDRPAWSEYEDIITEISIGEGITNVSDYAFYHLKQADTVVLPSTIKSIGKGAFDNCSSLQSIHIPFGVTSIGAEAFIACKSLTEISIPGSVTVISSNLFENCSSLKKICIPDTIKKIGSYPIRGAKDDLSIYYDGTESEWNKIEFSAGFKNTLKEKRAVLHFINGDAKGYFDYVNYKGGNNSSRWTFDWNDDWFFDHTYNHNLAKLSLKAEMSAFGLKYGSHNEKARNIKHFMDACEFEYTDESIDYPDWDRSNYNTIGYAIGSKMIESKSGEETRLVLVAVRGAGYGYEWGGNFNVGKDVEHKGFNMAAETVCSAIDSYLCDTGYGDDNVKIWLVGYSRAAAVANLTAAKLDAGYLNKYGIDKDNVVAYTFETPQGTTSASANTSQYHNIYNIVNPDDLIPVVAPAPIWNFRRYGRSYYLPTVDNSSKFYTQKEAMLRKYREIVGMEDSRYNAEFAKLVRFGPDQQSVYDVLIDMLVAITDFSRNKFVDYYQKAAIDAVLDAMVGDDADIAAIAVAAVNQIIHDEYKSCDNDVENVLKTAKITGKALLALVAWATYAGLDFITNSKLVKDTFVKELVDAKIRCYESIGISHYPELQLAWMEAVNGDIVKRDKGYEKNIINCPVDVTVKDSDNRVVAQIINDEVVEIENGLNAYVDSDGQKIVVTPDDGEYSISIVPREEGEMTYISAKYSDEYYDVPQAIECYQNLNLAEGEEYTVSVDETDVEVRDSNDTVLTPSFSETDITMYEVNVNVAEDCKSGIAYGGGEYYTGEFAKVTAIPLRGSDVTEDFDGWYVDDVCVSTDMEYRFPVEGDIELEARFKDISGQMWIAGVDANGYTYSGNPVKPEVMVYDGTTLLTEKVDYTISYANNTNVYTLNEKDTGFDKKKAPAVIITGKGDFKDKEYVYFTINQKSIEDEDITVGDLADLNYKNSVQKPVPAVKFGKKSLALKKDFKVSYYRNYDEETDTLSDLVAGPDADSKTGPQDEGRYYVCVEGIGSFTGKVVKSFDITKKTLITKPSLTKIKDKNYTGEVQYPTEAEINMLLKDGSVYLKAGDADSNPAGDYDYEISYSPEKPVNAGTVTVTIKAKEGGKYIGKRTTTYTIKGTPLSKAYMEPSSFHTVYDYDGTAKTQDDVVFYTAKNSGTKLIEGKDYRVTYQKNVNAGTATVIYTGMGGYTGEVKKTYKINPFDVVDAKTKLVKDELSIEIENEDSIVIDKGGVKPSVTVKFKDGKGNWNVLTEKTDYTVSYAKNTAVYTDALGNLAVDAKKAPSVSVTLKGNYKNKAVKYFNINPKDLSSEDIKVTASDAVYKAKAGAWKVTPVLTDKDGKKLSAGADYSKTIIYRYMDIPEGSIIYNSAVDDSHRAVRNAGDTVDEKDIVPAGVRISMEITAGTGTLYKGSRSADTLTEADSYRVVAKDISKANATVLVAKTYTGKKIELNPDEFTLTIKDGSTTKTLDYYNEATGEGDYRIVEGSYKNNLRQGKATFEIEGLGNYGGRKTITFTIGQKLLQWWWNFIQ